MKKESNYERLTKAHDEFAPGLARYAHSKIRDAALGDDLVQATFMKTWLYLQKTGKIDLMRAFLYHVLNRLIIDEYRKKKTASLDQLTEKGFDATPSVVENIFNIIDAKALASLIKKLPEKYRSVMTMRYIKEMSFKEMSAATNQTQNTLSVQVHRGLIKLRTLSSATV